MQLFGTSTLPGVQFDLPRSITEGRIGADCISTFTRQRFLALEKVYGSISKGDRCLIIPMGGGGDCVGASIVLYDLVQNLKAEAAVFGLTLKRPSQTNSNKPLGCLPIADFQPLAQSQDLQGIITRLNLKSLGLITENTQGPGGLTVDEVRLHKLCSSHPAWRQTATSIGLLNPAGGVAVVTDELKKLLSAGNFKHVFFVDVGGDVVTEGAAEDKQTLWSPVLDQMMNFVSVRLARDFHTRTLVAGLGGDGEITHDRFIKQHDAIAAKGGFFGGIAFPLDGIDWYRELLTSAKTETSRQIMVALDHILQDSDKFGQFVSVQTHLNALATDNDRSVPLPDLFLFDLPVSLRNGTRSSGLNVLTPYVMSYDPEVIVRHNQFNWLGEKTRRDFMCVVDEMRRRGFRTEMDNSV